jgi:hypothetical protein
MVLVTIINNPAIPCESCGESQKVRVQALMGRPGTAAISIILCEKCLHTLADMMWDAFTDEHRDVEGG